MGLPERRDDDAGYRHPITRETLPYLASAPFRPSVLARPWVWAGVPLALAAGLGISYLVDRDAFTKYPSIFDIRSINILGHSFHSRAAAFATGEAYFAALFDPVVREPRLSDKVAEMMLETILSNRLQVGDRLPSERELGEQFGVSRTVVREAVRALVAKGVIEVRSGSGLRVAAVAASAVSESMSLYVRGAPQAAPK